MHDNDKTEFFNRLNGIMEVFGKPKLTPAAAQVWWDTVRDLDHNDAFTVLGYWAQSNSKPPAPRDVWQAANNARTERLEERAARERDSNRGMVATDWRPNEYGRKMLKECLRVLSNRRKPEGRYEWAKKIVNRNESGAVVPYITLKLARDRLAERVVEVAA